MPTTSTPLTTTGVVIEVMAGDEGVIRKQGKTLWWLSKYSSTKCVTREHLKS